MELLQGKTAVVTGAGSGMGRAFAERFARAGMKVVLADVEAPKLDEAVESIVANGAEAIGVVTDVTDGAAVDRLRDTPTTRTWAGGRASSDRAQRRLMRARGAPSPVPRRPVDGAAPRR
jgi:NAD(P)-dependent dehydrogenase (short-subunit alcohol dehydrogenase family)